MSQPEKPLSKDLPEPEQLVTQYVLTRPLYEEFTKKLVELLKVLLKVRNIDIHLIESRTKDVESFREKVSRASKRYINPLEEVTDLAGIRIIVYYAEDLENVCKLIGDEFQIDTINSVDKRSVLKPEEFGYQSIHFIAKLSRSRCILAEWSHMADLQVEIQVRTVLQHAWAAISHKLQYKREGDIPRELRRRLFRLSALLELADEEFMALRDKTITLTQTIEQQLLEGETNLEINLLTIEEFLRTSSEVDQLMAHAYKAGFSFEDYVYEGESETISEIVVICEKVGITNISSLKSVVQESINWSEAYLESQMRASSTSSVGWEASPGFICTLMLIGKFHDCFEASDLEMLGWDEDIASRVLEIAHERN